MYEGQLVGTIAAIDFGDNRLALRFIPLIAKGQKITHHAEHNGKHFFWESFWQPNLTHGWGFDWQSIFYEDQAGAPLRIGEDQSTIRAFTKDEIKLCLKINGFQVRDCLDRASYAFDTFVMIAE